MPMSKGLGVADDGEVRNLCCGRRVQATPPILGVSAVCGDADIAELGGDDFAPPAVRSLGGGG